MSLVLISVSGWVDPRTYMTLGRKSAKYFVDKKTANLALLTSWNFEIVLDTFDVAWINFVINLTDWYSSVLLTLQTGAAETQRGVAVSSQNLFCAALFNNTAVTSYKGFRYYHHNSFALPINNSWFSNTYNSIVNSVVIQDNLMLLRSVVVQNNRRTIQWRRPWDHAGLNKQPMAQKAVESSWNVMAHGDAREGKWRGNWRMEWVASTLHTTSEHGVSSITNLTLVQKGVFFSGSKIYNHLPLYIKMQFEDAKRFKSTL
jgi:hypothetical protein